MATESINQEQLYKTTEEAGGIFFSAWSEAAGLYQEAITNAQATKVLTENEKYQILVQTLGPKLQQAATNAKTWADAAAAKGEHGVGIIMNKYAAKFAEQAAGLTSNLKNEKAAIEAMVAEGNAAIQFAQKITGGGVGRVAGLVIDAAQVGKGLWEWNQTGSSKAFVDASAGVFFGAVFGALFTKAATGVPHPFLKAILAGIGAGLGSAYGADIFDGMSEFFRNLFRDGFESLIPDWLKKLFDLIPSIASPLVLDIDGDGLELSHWGESDGSLHDAERDQRIYFDHEGDGLLINGTWVKDDDGLLVMDRNGNGIIDNGKELFGNNTQLSNGQNAADGYAALNEQDTNGDGVVNSQDANWESLRVWRDVNQDGESQAEELSSLNQLNISEIGLAIADYSEEHWDGTVVKGKGSFVLNGQGRTYSDVWFGQDTFHRRFAESITLSGEAMALPNVKGSGAVRDLREAAMQSPELKNLVEQFVAAGTSEQRKVLTEKIVEAWGNTSGMTTSYSYRDVTTDSALTYSFWYIDSDSADAVLWAKRMGTVTFHPNGATDFRRNGATLTGRFSGLERG